MQTISVEHGRGGQSSCHRADRCHYDVDLLVAQPPECGCPRLLNIRVRCEPSVRIGFPCRKWTHAVNTVCVELCMEIINICGERFDGTILRGHNNKRPPQGLR